MSKLENLPRQTSGPLECPYEGLDLIHSSRFNKGSAHPDEERKKFKLHGLLPPNVQTLEEQVQRAYQQYKSRKDDLAKNTFLASMKSQNEVGEEVDYIVVSDGEEVTCRAQSPTQNEDLLDDELYLGLRKPRVKGKAYDDFVDKFVKIARKKFPKAYIHFEDFGTQNAKRILDKFRSHIPCFNDDIQGTGCVTLAAMIAGLHVSHIKLEDVRVVIFGSGSAGIGIADQITDAIVAEAKRPKSEASKQIWCFDKPGLLVKSFSDKLTVAQAQFARDDKEWPEDEERDLLSVVKKVKPHVLIGTSTKPKAFTEDIIREMGKHVQRPIVFPLSNPTRLHEAHPDDIYHWTEGRALVATGSPFPPVEHNGMECEIAECNNSTCFPGIGLGAVLSRAKVVSNKMLVAAVKALAARSPALQDPTQPLLPGVEHVRELSVNIAKAVIQSAVKEGHAQQDGIPTDESDLDKWIRAQMWEPVYRPLVKAEQQ
ncbi:NAD-dependent malic enzyme, mitochondrial [Aspergillus wentii]|nr:NAD-dependent malic enzyme, mitochondrial [Aspergillus wentii]